MASLNATIDVLMNRIGVRTSEFWLSTLLLIASFVLLWSGKISPDDVEKLWPIFGSSGLYALSRGLSKTNVR